MTKGVNIDDILVTWGDRLFYPDNRMVKGSPQPKLTGDALRRHAAVMRGRVAATVRRAPQVMVKVTGGGRGISAIAAHLRYISKNGRLDIEDDRGEAINGSHAVRDLADDWRFGGSLIAEDAPDGRREALNIMLSMPRGTDPLAVHRAAREFAHAELAGHKYVMVLHDHQANPHVHLSVRVEGRDGKRLKPRKSDLQRWREVFAEKLRELGVDAEATRQATRGVSRNYDLLWRVKARQEGRLTVAANPTKAGKTAAATRIKAMIAWGHIRTALIGSELVSDRALGERVTAFVRGKPFVRHLANRARPVVEPGPKRSRPWTERLTAPDRTR